MGPSSVLELPLLPLRDVVVYPHMVLPLFVGREKSIEALEDAMASDKQVLLVAQRNAAEDNPSADDMYQVGTVSNILQLLKLPDGTIKVLVEGVSFLPSSLHFFCLPCLSSLFPAFLHSSQLFFSVPLPFFSLPFIYSLFPAFLP